MKIGTDKNGKVWLVGDSIPTEWNGLVLTVHELNDKQGAEYNNLPTLRGGVTFIDGVFTAEPAPIKPNSEIRREEYNARGATIEALVVAMFEKDAEEIARLEAIRQSVKQEIPTDAAQAVRTK